MIQSLFQPNAYNPDAVQTSPKNSPSNRQSPAYHQPAPQTIGLLVSATVAHGSQRLSFHASLLSV